VQTPTLTGFWERFKKGHGKLDAINDEAIQRFKGKLLSTLVPKAANNVLTLLAGVLRRAEKWGAIGRAPRVELFKATSGEVRFLDLRGVRPAGAGGGLTRSPVGLMVLLGGGAGLRRGEIAGLEWLDVDLARALLTVQRSVRDGHVTVPKGGRSRKVPLTSALSEALRRHPRPIHGGRILLHEDGSEFGRKALHLWMGASVRRACLGESNGLHVLRHTFCSHLAMQGAPAKAIQELAGHADLATTMRYMHLSPAARDSAIRLLVGRPGFDAVSPSVSPSVESSRNAVETR
jgi:integrase